MLFVCAAAAGFRGGFCLPLGARALLGSRLRGARARGPRRADFSARDRALFRPGTLGTGGLDGSSLKVDPCGNQFSKKKKMACLNSGAWLAKIAAAAHKFENPSSGHSCLHSFKCEPSKAARKSVPPSRQELPHSCSPSQPNRARADAPQTKAAAKNDVRLRHLRPSIRGGAAGHR